MHDSSVATLRDAVGLEFYNRTPTVVDRLILTPAERDDLVAFLEVLTSESA